MIKDFLSIGAIIFVCVTVFHFWQNSREPNRIPVEVVEVIDGDTIKVDINGKEEKIRYLLVDTPELSGDEPFAQEAKQLNEALLSEGKVEIEYDFGDRKDKYDRTLAYVYVDGKMVQESLLEAGMAEVAYIYPPNVKHLWKLWRAEREGKKADAGLWAMSEQKVFA